MDRVQLKNKQGNNIYPQVLSNNVTTKSGLSSGDVFEVPYFPLVMGTVDNAKSEVKSSTTSVSMENAIVVPYKESILYFTLPDYIKVKIHYSDNELGTGYLSCGNRYSSSKEYKDGESFQFPSTANLFRLEFSLTVSPSSPKEITVQLIKDLISKDLLRVVYVMNVGDVVHRNCQCTKYAFAMKQTAETPKKVNEVPIFLHMSDCHGDAIRTRDFFEYADFIGAKYSLLTGDFVSYSLQDGMSFVYELAQNHKTIPLICTGNHDHWGAPETVLQTEFNKFSTKYKYNQYQTYTYYYKDLEDIKIRVIALEDFENSFIYKSQRQIDWFISTLSSTPKGYGIIIINHGLEVPCIKEENNDKFYETEMYFDDSYLGKKKMDVPTIMNLVDAFIGRTSITETCNYSGHGSITYAADFSNIDPSIEFICYASGHIHRDYIGVLQGSKHKQVELNITPNCTTQPNARDVPMGYGKSSAQNVFNVYGIDRLHHKITIARVGGTVTHDFKNRDVMTISYK